MKRFVFLLIASWLVLSPSLKADEGMWLLPLLEKLNIKKMNEMGLQLTAEDIYSINKSSLKDAIVVFGGGCTAEIVSKDGLLFTNHHCGRGSINQHTTVEHDYLRDGFWAFTRDQELVNPGLTVTFLVRMEDVSHKVNEALKDNMTEMERNTKIDEVSKAIVDEAIKGTHYSATVRSYFGGNQYYLLVFERYLDVRLVGAPPSSIGDYGADTDNWMWPRHTGDFSIFRVYMGPDGNPAPYSPNNIPLKPRYYLPISLKGVKLGDFTMVIGNPGVTQRYITSWEVNELLTITNPNTINLRGTRLDILLKDMLADPVVMTHYRAKHAAGSNGWKKAIGVSKDLNDLNVMERKQEMEGKFVQWIDENKKRQEKYGEALSLIQHAIEGRKDYLNAMQYLNECFLRGPEIIGFTRRLNDLYALLKAPQPDQEAIKKEAQNQKNASEDYFLNYNAPTDRKVLVTMMEIFYKNVPKESYPEMLNQLAARYNGDFNAFVNEVFENSIFTSQQRFDAFLDNPQLSILEGEAIFQFSNAAFAKSAEIRQKSQTFDQDYQKGMRLFIAGLMEMQKEKVFYPDANGTFRLTYGIVGDYYPRDAVHYLYYTTLKGVMEKEIPGNWEFSLPDKLKELYAKKDYGRYGMGDDMPVCFTTNNDITGGNSGSPVMNGKGELIGLAFDGNWEAMSGDVIFEPALQKCICVDIRYVLFIIDKFAGATNLINELDLRQ
jgi:hypothetical protein